VPKFIKSPDWLPRSMLVPEKLALLVTLSDAPAALVMAPAEVNARLPAVLAPASCVAELSLITTASPTKLRLPKLTGAVPPRVMLAIPALKRALPPTSIAPLFAIMPAAVIDALPSVARRAMSRALATA
jgi:hypothetical protein